MEIRTKFNIDDTVWIIKSEKKEEDCKYCEGKGVVKIKDKEFGCPYCHKEKKVAEKDFYFVDKTIKITDIRIWCLFVPEIRYFDENKYEVAYEEDCFATKEEAEAECNKRNKEETEEK